MTYLKNFDRCFAQETTAPPFAQEVRKGWGTPERLLFLFRRACDDQIVVYAEGTGGGVGLHTGDCDVAGIVDYAIEGDVAVLHDDVDGVDSRWVGLR